MDLSPVKLLSAALALGGTGLFFMGLWRMFVPNREMKWIPVDGTVHESGIDESDEGADSSYFARVAYTYEFGGITYYNDRVSPLEFWSNWRGPAEAIVRQFPRGRAIKVYVNPRNPGKSVLRPGRQVWPAIMLCIFGAVMWFLAEKGMSIT